MNFKEKLNQFKNTLGIDRTVEQKKESKYNSKNDLEWIGFKDTELITNGAIISRKVFNERIKNNHNLSKTDILTYIAVSYHCSTNGKAKLSQQKISRFLGYKSNSRVNQSINKLEQQELIEVNKDKLPFEYEVLDLQQGFKKGSKGVFLIPKTIIQIMRVRKLKDIRLLTYLLSLNHHLPNNKNKFAIKYNTLSEVIKATCYEEVKRIYNRLKGIVFKSVEFVQKARKTANKGFEKVKGVIGYCKLGIGINLDRIKYHSKYNDVNHLRDEQRRLLLLRTP